MAKELGREYFAGFSPAAERALLGYGWPGNIRELRNVVERAVYRVEHEYSTIEALEFDPFASPYRPKAMASQLSTTAIEPAAAAAAEPVRSEEHTSELQSLMRISYAVCCLTKKKTMQ